MTMGHSSVGEKRRRSVLVDENFVEGADYLVDMEISNRRKKRVRVDFDHVGGDENYTSFLAELEDYWESKFVEEDEDVDVDVDVEGEGEGEDADVDPAYAMFLENLKEHGNAYMLDVSMEHGVHLPIVYEAEVVSSRGIKRKKQRTRQDTNIRKQGSLKVDKEMKSRPKNSPFDNESPSDDMMRRTLKTNQSASIRKGRRLDDVREPNSVLKYSGFEDESPSDVYERATPRFNQGYIAKEGSLDVGRQRKSGLRNSVSMHEVGTDTPDVFERRTQSRRGPNLEEEGRPDVFEELNFTVKKSCFVVKSEIDHSDVNKRKTLDSVQGTCAQKKVNVDAYERSMSGLRNSNFVSKVANDPSDFMRTGTPRFRKDTGVHEEGNLDIDRGLNSGLKNSGFISQDRPDPLEVNKRIPRQGKGGLDVDREINSGLNNVEMDEAYSSFLTGLNVIGESLVFEYGDHKQIHYEEIDQHTGTATEADSAIEPTEAALGERVRIPLPPTSSFERLLPLSSIPLVTSVVPPTSSIKEAATTLTPSNPNNKAPTNKLTSPTLSSVVPLAEVRPHRDLFVAPITTLRPPTPVSRALNAPSSRRTLPDNHDVRKQKIPSGKTFDDTQLSPEMLKKLENILRKPYAQKEYDSLWKDLHHRTPVQIYRESRSGGSHRPGPMGKSYLDSYEDANDEIEKVKSDTHKVLNLMRMLVFYIQHLAYGKIPKPWKDAYLKSILPGSRST